MPDFRFLHAADLHLDSPLRGLEADPSAPAELIRGATRKALGRLVDLAIAENVDFVVIAGDIYDGDWPDFGTGLFFANQMRRLTTNQIPVFAIRGNHDAANRMTRDLRMPHVTIFDHACAHTHQLEAIGVAIHGQSFADRAVPHDLSKDYPRPVDGWFNIGLLHTSAEGYAAHARYAPCDLHRLRTHGYDYWALGHVHERQELAIDPWVVFPGNLQGRHVGETGAKGASLVTVNNQRVSVQHRILDVLRWAHIEVDLDGVPDEAEAMIRVQQHLEAALRVADPNPLAARVTLTGTTRAHAALSGEGLRDKVLNEAHGLTGEHRLWLEAVKLRTRPPRNGHAGPPGQGHASPPGQGLAVPTGQGHASPPGQGHASSPRDAHAGSPHDNLSRLLAEIDSLVAAPPPDLLSDWPATLAGKLGGALPADHPLHACTAGDLSGILEQARRRLEAALAAHA